MNEIIDDLISKAKDFATTAGQKTNEIIDVSKLRVSIADIKGAMKKNFEDIGRYYYEMQKDEKDNSALIENIIADLEEKQKKLDEMTSKYNELKNILTCPKCGNKNKLDDEFCSKCGEKLK